jgi:hypothetical protein
MPYFLILHFYFATFRCAVFTHILFTNHQHDNSPSTPAKSRKKYRYPMDYYDATPGAVAS